MRNVEPSQHSGHKIGGDLLVPVVPVTIYDHASVLYEVKEGAGRKISTVSKIDEISGGSRLLEQVERFLDEEGLACANL